MTGDKLPAIPELAEQYNVALITVRTALRNLQEDGYIRMSQGKNAYVVFDNTDFEGNEKYWRCIVERKKSLTEVCEVCSLIFPPMMAEAARRLNSDEIAELERIIEETHPRMKVYRLMNQIDLFHAAIYKKLDNALFSGLVNEINEFIDVIPILPLGSQAHSAHYTAVVRNYMENILENIKTGNDRELKNRVSEVYLEAVVQLNDAVDRMAAGMTAEKEVSFTWILPDCSQLSKSIAYTVMYKVSLGEYQNGDYLPSERAFQEYYTVSKKPIRAAMTLLNELGLAVTVKGKGTQIKAKAADHMEIEKMRRFVQTPSNQNAMQIVELTFLSVSESVVPKLSAEAAEDVEGRLYDLKYDRAGKYVLCSPTALVLDMVVTGSENKALNLIFHRLMSRMIVGNYLRVLFKENYPEIYSKSLENNFKAVEKAKKNDAEGFNIYIKQVLTDVFSIPFGPLKH